MTGLSRGASELLPSILVDLRLSSSARCLLALVVTTGAALNRTAIATHFSLTARHIRRVLAEIATAYPDISVLYDGTKMSPADKNVPSPYKERAPACVSHQNERDSKSSDDENSGTLKTPTPERPEQVFRSRIGARHPGTDLEHCLRSVKRYLGAIELPEFLAYDEKRTMSPHLLRNPTGHYVALAKAIARQDRDKLLIAALTPRKPMEVERCSCRGGRLAEGYCGCSMGKDLQRVERRANVTATG